VRSNILATANKKVLPTDGMNANQLAIKAQVRTAIG
jgi:hypothetical protein